MTRVKTDPSYKFARLRPIDRPIVPIAHPTIVIPKRTTHFLVSPAALNKRHSTICRWYAWVPQTTSLQWVSLQKKKTTENGRCSIRSSRSKLFSWSHAEAAFKFMKNSSFDTDDRLRKTALGCFQYLFKESKHRLVSKIFPRPSFVHSWLFHELALIRLQPSTNKKFGWRRTYGLY